MSTYMPNAGDISRKWYIIDAAGKPLGRVATVAASILRGKYNPKFTPHVDCGDFVIVLNAGKAVLTGKKLDQKVYYRHTGYVGGIKAVKYRKLMETRPEQAMQLAVKGMIPDTTMGRKALTRLRVYAAGEHKHAAQNPEIWAF